MPFRWLSQLLQLGKTDMGIDLGTANTVVYLRKKGVVLSEPSVVALDKKTRQVLAVGDAARAMVGRTPGNIIAVRPMKDGVIADFDITEMMIRTFIQTVSKKFSVRRPRVLVGVPWGITAVERRAVIDAAMQAGASEAQVIDEPMAAAIGANITVSEPNGNMIVDVGGGTTEVAVISLGGIVVCKSIRVAGDELDDAIVSHCKKNYNLLIGERMAERIKMTIGSAFLLEDELEMEIKGRDLMTGLPKNFTLSSSEIRDAMSEPLSTIIDTIRSTLEQTPPELSADIMEHGIVLAGGGALLKHLDALITDETALQVNVANDPLNCVALGTGMILEEMDTLRGILGQNLGRL